MADPAVERRVREDMIGADLADPRAIDGIRYLEGCLQEAMRLWPTTPLLARVAFMTSRSPGSRSTPAPRS